MKRKALKAAFPQTIPIMTVFLFLGFAYGIYMNTSGFTQQIITIGLCVLGTMTTRFLPFIIFRESKETPEFIQYIGNFLPSVVFGMLVIYCLRNVNVPQGTHGIPEAISILVTSGLHIWKRQMMLSIAGGTICYMILIHMITF